MTVNFTSTDIAFDSGLDLNELLIAHPAATFFVRVRGEMKDEQIASGDILIVDRAIIPKKGSLVLCIIEGVFALKRFHKKSSPIEVWGTVTYVIQKR